MEEDHSWMYRRTVHGVMGITSEFQLCMKRFHTQQRGYGSLTYNCGVWVKGDYHGVLNEIIEIHEKYKLVEVHIKKKYARGYDPLILSSQAEQVTCVPYPTPKRQKNVPLVDVPFQEDFDIDETSRIDVDVQDIGILIHELDKLELVDIRRKSSIVDKDENNEDEKEVEWESNKKEEEEEFESESDSET
ncbi:hypothetical protein M9H77_27936 [Catharanthus roseus]|uniref:Uncharacterized protein n=1 Tax=Catharanthus roseus TaxID=4058 RepID=A0ACC0ADY1_CATRO|nr:hypothetical protein M9H77_27936 [Catharanthus roseus]